MRGWPAALLTLLWLAPPAAHAQAPAWTQLSSGVPVTSNGFSYVQASAADAAGNVYVSGYFFGTVRFGTTQLTSDATTSPSASDGFVAKWSSATGTFVWAVALGGSGADQAPALAVSNGSVYVGGHFYSPTAAFGPLSLTNTTSATSSSDAFVAKLTDAGTTANFMWVRQVGGTDTDMATSLAVSGSNVYLAGLYSSPTLAIGGTVLTNANAFASDTFVAKFTDAGATTGVAWALSFGSTGSDEARALAVSGSSIYVLGDFTSSFLSLGTTALTNAAGSAGTPDVFLAKLADAGTSVGVVWAQRAGGTGVDTGDALALNGASLYVAGSFGSATASVGTLLLTNASSTANTADVFVAKLTDAGAGATAVWAQSAGGIGTERPKGVAVRGTNVYVAGGYGYPNATFGATVLPNRGTATALDIFVAKLADSGSSAAFAWAQSAGGVNGESAYCVALTGNLVVTAGGAAAQATFGTLAVPPSATTTSAFVAAILDPTLTATAAAQGTLSFSLYPNPARNATTVQLPAQPGATTATLTLRDALGRTLRTETMNLPATGLRHEFDLANIPAGLYAVQVQAGAATATRQLVVE